MTSTLVVFPKHFHFENYKANLLAGYIPQAFANSIFIVVVKTLFQMTLTSLGAYAFTRKDVPGIRFFFTLFVIPMFFGGGLLPFYLTVRATTGLNNLMALIIPFGLSGYNMIVLRNFFSAIPESVIESCKIDGASDLRILVQFVLPLSKAGLATITLFYMVGTWNEWYWPSILLQDIELYPLALLVRQSLNPGEMSADRWKGTYDSAKTYGEGLNAAMTVIALAPILAIYPILQKYFTQGVMVGSVKG
jgi:putative aldouronate transport system permease protein